MKATLWGYLRNEAVNNLVAVNFNNKKYDAVYIKGEHVGDIMNMM